MSDYESKLLPSRTRDRYWIEVANPSGVWSDNSGKWLLFIPVFRVDSVWMTIRRETHEGRLGVAAKVATAMKNPLATSQRVRLICVYTYDHTDLTDVRRVRQRLRELGFIKKLPYKTDAATHEGQYVANGNRKVSLLFE